MTTPDQRSARAALDAARPAVARLDASRGSEDLAADLIETWSAVEAALRILVGSSVLTGQPLIREARQRQALNFDQANALAEFQAVRDRLQNTAYRPTDADVNSARVAVAKLDGALTDQPLAQPVAPGNPVAPPVNTATTPPPAVVPVATVRPGLPVWAKAALAVLALLLLLGVGYTMMGSSGSSSLQQGVDAYQRGQREAAVSAFNKASRDDPKSAMPHVYLARMAREVGNFTLASQELQLALQAEPSHPVALREMGANLLAQNNYELARRFYVRAVQADPADKSAQGYLACTLAKLGRAQEAASFASRAGPGPWSGCASASVAVPGVVPVPGAVPGAIPRR